MKHEVLDAWILGGLMIVANAGGSVWHLCGGLLIAAVASVMAFRD